MLTVAILQSTNVKGKRSSRRRFKAFHAF